MIPKSPWTTKRATFSPFEDSGVLGGAGVVMLRHIGDDRRGDKEAL
jgi:hypothetical protein